MSAIDTRSLEAVKAIDILALVRERTELKRSGDSGVEWKGLCPFHADSTPSLMVNSAKGKFYCHGCEEAGDVISWVRKTQNLDFLDAVTLLAERGGITLEYDDQDRTDRGGVDATYRYVDEDGALLYEVDRRERNGKKKFEQRPASGRRGSGAMAGVRLVLYRLDRITKAAAAGEVIYVVEGEKDVESIERAYPTIVATTSPAGAGKWRAEYAQTLVGSTVMIVADRDEPGRAHARAIAKSLDAAGIPYELLEAKSGKDTTDHLAAGHELWDLVPMASGEPADSQIDPPLVELGDTAHTALIAQPLDRWPEPLGEAAMHGVVGELVRLMDPHTEADPAAVLVQLLICFGNVVGRHSYVDVSGTEHYPNLFGVPVGDTASGRKGSSLSIARAPLKAADADWYAKCVQSGLSSGEGLIWAVRDQVVKTKRNGEREIEEGVADKRLLVIEEEFASVLRVATRDGNTVSALIRRAWDGGTLQTLTKGSPATATNAHVSIVGHITGDELRGELTKTDRANGFANRFLWICTRRSKLLPDGGKFHTVDLAPYARRLTRAIEHAQCDRRFERDEQASALWHEVYGALSTGRPGLYGAVTGRATAQVVRLSLVYALLDEALEIRLEHLQAALEVWRYADDSARFIFGDALGNPTADKIRGLLDSAEKGLTRSDLRDAFSGHTSSSDISDALGMLERFGLARKTIEDTRGRPAERWYTLRDKRDKRGKSQVAA